MNWRLEFYNERRGTLARYGVEAPTTIGALVLARDALLAEHAPTATPRRPSVCEQARRIGGQAADGWILYRIAEG
jgi:hypothetical protein